jgi:hypothetical protein
MSGEHAGTPSEELDRWLDRRAEREGVDRETLIERAVAAYRLVEEADDPDGAGFEEAERDRADLRGEVGALADRVGTVEDDLDEKIDDVRGRVVQVKRETDAKADADHDHPALDDRVDAAAADARAATEAVSDLADRVDRGFGNFEEVLDYLRDERDELDRKTAGLASAVVDLRERTAALEREADARAALDDLRREASRRGVTRGDCGDCGKTVHLGLLGDAACPHCGAALAGVEFGGRLFGSARFVADARPETDDADRRADDAAADDGFGGSDGDRPDGFFRADPVAADRTETDVAGEPTDRPAGGDDGADPDGGDGPADADGDAADAGVDAETGDRTDAPEGEREARP